MTTKKLLDRRAPASEPLRLNFALHDIRNLLQVVSGNLELLLIEPVSDDVQEHLKKAMRAADSASTLASLAIMGERTEDNEEFSVVEAVETCADLVKSQLKPNVQLCLSTTSDDVRMLGELELFQSVVINLVINASAAIGDAPGEILLQVTAMPHAFVLEIADDGPGLPDLNVLEPYRTTYNHEGSTGLGLPSVLNNVFRLRGGVEVRSQNGEGTSFALSFPRKT